MLITFFSFIVIFCYVASYPFVSKGVPNTKVLKNEVFKMVVPKDVFSDTNPNSRILVSMESNDLVKSTFVSPTVEIQYDNLNVLDFFLVENILYVATYRHIHVFNVSNLEQPEHVSSFSCVYALSGSFDRIFVEGKFLYITIPNLQIADISDPRNPKILDFPHTVIVTYPSESLYSFVVSGTLLYLCKDHKGLEIWSVEGISSTVPPKKIGVENSIRVRDVVLFHDYKGQGDYALVTGGSEGLGLINITDKSKPNVVLGTEVIKGTRIDKLDVYGNYAYLAEIDNSGPKAYVVDISDLLNYTLVGTLTHTTGFYRFTVYDETIAYAGERTPYDLVVVNITDKTKPSVIKKFNGDGISAVTFSRPILFNRERKALFLYGIKYDGLFIANISNVEKVDMTYRFNDEYTPKTVDFAIRDDIVYVLDSSFGIFVYRWTDPDAPLKYVYWLKGVNEDRSTMFALRMSEDGKYLYYVQKMRGIRIVDISDPIRPFHVGNPLLATFNSGVMGLAVYGDYAYVVGTHVNGQYKSRINILDISNKTAPFLVSEMGAPKWFPSECEGVFIMGSRDLLFCTARDNGFYIIDVKNKTVPEYLHTYESNDAIKVFFLEDNNNLVFLADGSEGIVVLNITNTSFPSGIEEVGRIDTDGSVDVFVEGNTVLSCDGTSYGFKIVDISNLLSPKRIWSADEIRCSRIMGKGNYIFLSDEDAGFRTVRVGLQLEGRSNMEHFCGETTVTICGEDLEGNKTTDSFVLSKESYCGVHGLCMEHHQCLCTGEYKGSSCESWSCGGYDFMNREKACSGNGVCKSPEECDCDGGFVGDYCDQNILYATVMAPVLGLSGISFFVFIILLVVMLCCCCCFGILCLICCFVGLILGLVCCLCCCIFCCSCFVLRQMKGLKKFKKLKNFDLLLKEQEMEEDLSIAHLKINTTLFEVDRKDINLVSILGEGGSASVVYKAKWRGKDVAYKCFKTRTLCEDQDSFDEFEREVQVMSSVNHPNILQFYGASLDPPRVGIIMEFCANGDLGVFLGRYKQENGYVYPVDEKLRMAREICSSLEYLHSRNVIHRDLKMENVLVDSKEKTKLMDFGLSKIVDRMSQIKTKRVGTSVYMAPEIITSGDYDEKCDVFSYSILLFILFTENRQPYENKDFDNSSNSTIEYRVAGDPNFRPNISEVETSLVEEVDDEGERSRRKKISGFLRDVIIQCWSAFPKDRMEFSEINEKLGEFEEDLEKPDVKVRRKTLFRREKKDVTYADPETEIVGEEEELSSEKSLLSFGIRKISGKKTIFFLRKKNERKKGFQFGVDDELEICLKFCREEGSVLSLVEVMYECGAISLFVRPLEGSKKRRYGETLEFESCYEEEDYIVFRGFRLRNGLGTGKYAVRVMCFSFSKEIVVSFSQS